MTATTDPLRIAVVHPHALPARDDVAHHVAAEAAALAARGHRVTLLAPDRRRDRVAESRARLTAAGAGEPGGLLAAPGEVREVAVARALPGAGRRVGEPFDLASALETALSHTGFDVVHLHEPLAPSPALAALRHAPGATAVTFHRADPLVGVAFLRPLVDRALARADLRIATTDGGRTALAALLPGDYAVVAPGVASPAVPPPEPGAGGPPGVVVVARGRDRVAVRFGLSVLRMLDLGTIGAVTLIGPPDAPWRTRAAVPKALRERVEVLPDPGPAGRAEALARASIAVLAGPDEATGPVLREALALGRAVVVPRCPGADEIVAHGIDAVVAPSFSRDAWAAAVAGLAADPPRRAALGTAARERAGARTWDVVAGELERAYRAALRAGRRSRGSAHLVADLRVRPGAGMGPERLVAACLERGVDVVGVAAPAGVAPARAAAAAAPEGLTVIVGQEIATAEGVLIGLFMERDVAAGLSPEATAAAVHEQGGIVVVPDPAALPAPAPEVLRRLAGDIDCHEVLPAAGADPGDPALLRRLGLRVVAASGATRPADVGAAVTEVRRFDGPADLLEALADARLARRGEGGRARPGWVRARRNRTHES